MDKYFIPSIEDIRVGYECEYTSDGSGWVPSEIIKGKLYTLNVVEIIKWVIEYGYDMKDIIRVPYLTKEQIEAEGFPVLQFYPSGTPLYRRGDEHKGIEIVQQEKRIMITRVWSSFEDTFHREVIYRGTCKCINEFRTIIKLLGI